MVTKNFFSFQFAAESSDDSEFKFDENASDAGSRSSSSSSSSSDDESAAESDADDDLNADDEVSRQVAQRFPQSHQIQYIQKILIAVTSNFVPA